MKYLKDEILKPLGKIHGGVRLPHHKESAEVQTETIPTPNTVCIPLKQNIGDACEPLCAVGDKVKIGTKIGDGEKPLCVPVHSSVSGTVTEIADVDGVKCVVIKSDGKDEAETFTPKTVKTAQDLINAARECGLVGLGGAGFPAHIKLKGAVPDTVDTVIINGAECEPYITSDYRTCIEQCDDITAGIYRLKELLGFKNCIIAIEKNKPAAIEKLYAAATDKKDTDNSVRVTRLDTAYPQGAEKMLIYTTTRRKLSLGKLPSDVGCLIMNISSLAELERYIRTGKPLTHRRITVDGNALPTPKNLYVPLGISIANVLEYCGTDTENTDKILCGGPMMGVAVKDAATVITKQNNALLAFKDLPEIQTTPCIRCGKCASVCPMRLCPAEVDRALNFERNDLLEGQNINYCIECGSCSYICPAGRPLTQDMRLAKSILRGQKNV